MEGRVQIAEERLGAVEESLRKLESQGTQSDLEDLREQLKTMHDDVALLKKMQAMTQSKGEKDFKNKFNEKRAKDLTPSASKVDHSNFQDFAEEVKN